MQAARRFRFLGTVEKLPSLAAPLSRAWNRPVRGAVGTAWPATAPGPDNRDPEEAAAAEYVLLAALFVV